jgi:hypothetical protein
VKRPMGAKILSDFIFSGVIIFGLFRKGGGFGGTVDIDERSYESLNVGERSKDSPDSDVDESSDDSPNVGERSNDSPNVGGWSNDSPNVGEWSDDSPNVGEWSNDSPNVGGWPNDSPNVGGWSNDSPNVDGWSNDLPNVGERSDDSPDSNVDERSFPIPSSCLFATAPTSSRTRTIASSRASCILRNAGAASTNLTMERIRMTRATVLCRRMLRRVL